MQKNAFKFSPFWVTFLSLLTLSLVYGCFAQVVQPLISWENFFLCLFPLLVSVLILPLTFKMIFNIPALVLTNDCLENNFRGYSIQWKDIADVQLSDSGYRSFGKLIINLKDPKKYFNSPVKKLVYNAKQLFVVNDFSILVDFVAGENDDIFSIVKAYWTKNAQH